MKDEVVFVAGERAVSWSLYRIEELLSSRVKERLFSGKVYKGACRHGVKGTAVRNQTENNGTMVYVAKNEPSFI